MSAFGFSCGLGLGSRRRGDGAVPPPPPPPPAPVALPVTPLARWHPQFSTVSVAGGRVTGASDLQGAHALAEVSAGAGAYAMTDGIGRPFWRFEGLECLVNETLPAHTRGCTVALVGRHHRAISSSIFSLGRNGATPPNTGGAMMNVSNVTGPILRGGDKAGTSAASGKSRMVVGSQMQVIVTASRTTANGGQRLFVNSDFADVAQISSGAASTGCEVGRFAYSPGTASINGGWGKFDLYEMIVFGGEVSNADAAAVAAALVQGWGIAPVTDSLIIEGDSIHQGTGPVTPGLNIAMDLTDPGAAHRIPANWRVVNMAASGAQVPGLVTRRDAANGVFDPAMMLAGGRNAVLVQIGVNDSGPSGNANYPASSANTVQRGDETYAAVAALINSGTTGYLQRGFEVSSAINIASNSNQFTAISQLRVKLRSASFLADTLSGAGQAYDGKVKRIELPLVTVNGDTIFDTTADASDTAYYVGDGIHPNAAGKREMAKAYSAAL